MAKKKRRTRDKVPWRGERRHRTRPPAEEVWHEDMDGPAEWPKPSSFADQMMAYAEPLLQEAGDDPELSQRALDIAMMCYNMSTIHGYRKGRQELERIVRETGEVEDAAIAELLEIYDLLESRRPLLGLPLGGIAEDEKAPADDIPPMPLPSGIPSAPTLFRLIECDEAGRQMIQQVSKIIKPALYLRDGRDVRRIRKTRTVEELADRVDLAAGLGASAWMERLRSFGPAEVVPVLRERLRGLGNEEEATTALEKFIAGLRWYGPDGAAALLEVFDTLGDYGQCLACTVLGLLGEQRAADRMWQTYQRLKRYPQKLYFVGPLWGLLDLGDPRVVEALAEWLKRSAPERFFELFGFAARAGDERIVPILLRIADSDTDSDAEAAFYALAAIAQRLGRPALERAAGAPAHKDLIDDLQAVSRGEVEEYYGLFFRGIALPEPAARAS